MSRVTSTTFSDDPRPPRWLRPFGWVALCSLVGAQVVAWAISPPDRDMGHLEKILYVHVPAAWTALIACTVVFAFSLLYLLRGRQPRHDLAAAAATEVGVVLTALLVALGSIWARPTWGVWWTWDPRLTTTAILLVIYVGYLALRSFTEDAERRANWSAAVGILGFLNVPVVYFSVRWWRTIHQVQSSPATVADAYAWGLRLNAIAFLLVFVYFLGRRYYAARLERAIETAAAEAALGEGVVHV